MRDLFAPIRDAIAIRVREEHKVPIAIVGAGEIADLAHLPAYAAHGLAVAGIFDINKDKARAVAERHRLPKVYESVEEIAGDKNVRYEAVLNVMDMLQQNQVTKVGLLAKPR